MSMESYNNNAKVEKIEDITEADINVDANGNMRRRQELQDGSVGFWSDEEVTEANRNYQENI